MAIVPIPLGPASDGARSKQGGGSLLVNCYPEETTGGRSQFSINTDPGLKQFVTVAANSGGRGGFSFGNKMYAVFGESLFRILPSGAANLIGTVAGQKPIVHSINRKAPNEQVTITTETENYILENDVLTVVSDVDIPDGVNSTAYLNGYTIYFLRDGSFYVSAINDTGNVNALDFAEAERDADGGVRVFANGEELWLLGENSLEVFRDTGTGTQPFEPLLGAGQGRGAGCISKSSVVLMNGALYWVNDDRVVVRAEGYSPRPISTHEVARDIETAFQQGLAEYIVGFSTNREGHQFYHLRCPLWCWVFDAVTGIWHKKESYLSNTWRGAFSVEAFGKVFVGDATKPIIYEYTDTTGREGNDPLIAKMYSGIVDESPNGLICDAFHLDVQTGVGVAAGEVNDINPDVILRVSGDGGMTWGREYRQKLGPQGNWGKRVRFNRLGRANGNGFQFEVSLPDAVTRSVFKAYAELRKTSF